MSDFTTSAEARVTEIRRAFDLSFALAPQAKNEETEDLIALRIRGDAYGLRVREIAAVAKAGRVVPLPSKTPELLGIAGIRGMVVPVYSLAVLLGYEPSREAPRWLALAGAGEPMALALGDFEGYLRLPRKDFHLPDRDPGQYIDQFARSGETVRSVIKIASIVAAVREGTDSRLDGHQK